MSKYDHRQLVVDAKRGDQAAAERLLEMHRPLLLRLARRTARQPADEDDLLQVGSLAMWKAIESYDPSKSKFCSFAGQRAQAAMEYQYRRFATRRGRLCHSGAQEGEDWSLADVIPAPASGDAERLCAMERLEPLLSRLTARFREIALRCAAGETHPQVAKAMGVSRQRIHQIYHKALAEMRAPARQRISRATFWTPPRLLILRDNREKGYRACAHILGRSVVAVRSAVAKHGLQRYRHLRQYDLDRLLELHRDGETTGQIASKLGCSAETVRVKLVAAGMASNAFGPHWRKSEKRKDACRRASQLRVDRDRQKVADLGCPAGMGLAEAITLVALRERGPGDRDHVVTAVAAVSSTRGWNPPYVGWQSALRCCKSLVSRGLVSVGGAGNRRRVYAANTAGRAAA